MIRRKFLFALLMIVLVWPARADEGMWLPFLLSGKQYNDMVSRGFRLTAEDLYSVNQASLKDAIVLFGRGCTGELVSAEGLLLTNHHCGYSRIQQHSSVAHDYLADGFWAMQKGEELPNPGLTASRLVRMQDVTAEMVKALNPQMSEKERSEAIKKKGAELAKKAVEGTHYEGEVKPFYYGNQFILIIMEVFKDVRLVGAPPSAIGKFGGDTDNWMWPRHTGDFSIFRIYAGKDNKPAPYDKENQPYKPEKFLEISLNGVSEGDFTMVYGFPAQTEQYLPAVAIRHLQQHIYPLTVAIRDKELEVINEAMASSQALRIMYAARQAGVANGWKKLKGVIPGLERYQVEDLKTAEEKILRGALDIFPLGRDEYIGVMEEYNKTYSSMLPYDVWQTAFNECFWKQPLFRFVFKGYWLPGTDQKNDKGKEAFDKTIEDIVKSISGTYKGMDMTT
ncbi:MAG TPA: S46 family peptidase, partial [Bacteroidales bacterium]|nr:S46 family peptidase [Bacteroidales bacterium]